MSRIFPPNVLAPVWELAQDHPNFNFKITFLQRKCGDRKLVLAPQISLHMKLKKNIPLHLTKTKYNTLNRDHHPQIIKGSLAQNDSPPMRRNTYFAKITTHPYLSEL